MPVITRLSVIKLKSTYVNDENLQFGRLNSRVYRTILMVKYINTVMHQLVLSMANGQFGSCTRAIRFYLLACTKAWNVHTSVERLAWYVSADHCTPKIKRRLVHLRFIQMVMGLLWRDQEDLGPGGGLVGKCLSRTSWPAVLTWIIIGMVSGGHKKKKEDTFNVWVDFFFFQLTNN